MGEVTQDLDPEYEPKNRPNGPRGMLVAVWELHPVLYSVYPGQPVPLCSWVVAPESVFRSF
jgi:hypothetical protein